MAKFRYLIGALFSATAVMGLDPLSDISGPFNPVMTLVNSSSYGLLYNATIQVNETWTVDLPVLHAFGGPYEWGTAVATHVPGSTFSLINGLYKYLEEEVESYVPWLPEWFVDLVIRNGLDIALDLTLTLLRPHIADEYWEEARGIADGIGMSANEVLRASLFPELIKAQCTIIGAWGPALAATGTRAARDICTDDRTGVLQVRALDFGLEGPFANFPVLMVYHHNETAANKKGHSFVSLGWTGFIGSLTGMSGKMAISEKVWLTYGGTSSRAGIPFHFLLRDIIHYDVSLGSALTRIANAPRTCSIFVGAGSQHDSRVNIIAYAHDNVTYFDDVNFEQFWGEDDTRFVASGLTYVDKHEQPSTSSELPGLLRTYYGNLTADVLATKVITGHRTGDLHSAVFDLGNQRLLTSIAGPGAEAGRFGSCIR